MAAAAAARQQESQLLQKKRVEAQHAMAHDYALGGRAGRVKTTQRQGAQRCCCFHNCVIHGATYLALQLMCCQKQPGTHSAA
jgi:hypothetical protein